MMRRSLIFISILCYLTLPAGCKAKREEPQVSLHIIRFDKDLYQLILNDTPELQKQLTERYPVLLELTGKSLFRMTDIRDPAFFDRMVNYYSEPTLNKLYRDVLKQYDIVETIEKELSASFESLQAALPDLPLPTVYMHVSGLMQNVLVGDGLLSISIDKYMGADYPLYAEFFHHYERQRMTTEYIVPDYLRAWLISEYPFRGAENVLLDRMIYEGKIRYILQRALPQRNPEIWLGYTPEEYQWCQQHEKEIWQWMIEHKHIYTPDITTVNKYFSDRPSSFMADEAPGNLGVRTGWRIVEKYMDKTGASINELLMNTDYQDILTKSKYKP
ncbi:MAG: gliding motility protein GldB [Tannerella sp.]|jgi:uncharacterized protein YjaZ|nr:gliding motility protein GldB [Tannerella sp.]